MENLYTFHILVMKKIERILINKGDNVAAGQELVKIESFDAQNIFLRAEEKLSAESALLRIWNLANGLKSWILYVRRLKKHNRQNLR